MFKFIFVLFQIIRIGEVFQSPVEIYDGAFRENS